MSVTRIRAATERLREQEDDTPDGNENDQNVVRD